MAVRHYNHAGFVSAMPVGSETRERWSATYRGVQRYFMAWACAIC